MFNYEEIFETLPMDQIADQVGEPRSEVEHAVRNALPALFMGLEANAQDPAGEASLARALQSHDPSLIDGEVSLPNIDTADGAKISQHIFGDNEGAVVQQLGGLGGGDSLMKKLLPILSPIVMSWLARKLTGRNGQDAGETPDKPGILGDLLSKALGNRGAEQAPPPPAPSGEPKFRSPSSTTSSGGPTMPFPGDGEAPQPKTQQTNQPSGGGLGGGVLGQILGDLLGGGSR